MVGTSCGPGSGAGRTASPRGGSRTDAHHAPRSPEPPRRSARRRGPGAGGAGRAAHRWGLRPGGSGESGRGHAPAPLRAARAGGGLAGALPRGPRRPAGGGHGAAGAAGGRAGEVAEAARAAARCTRCWTRPRCTPRTGLRFSPATVDGQPAPVRLHFEYRFEAPAAASLPARTLRAPRRRAGEPARAGARQGQPPPAAGRDAGLGSRARRSAPRGDGRGRSLRGAPAARASSGVRGHGARPPARRAFARRCARARSLEVVYALEPLVVNPYETVVRGGARRAPRCPASRCTTQELREVPGTMGDPFRVVMLMPGRGQHALRRRLPGGARQPARRHRLLPRRHPRPHPLPPLPRARRSSTRTSSTPSTSSRATRPPQYGRLMGGAIEGRLTPPARRPRARQRLRGPHQRGPLRRVPLQVHRHQRLAWRAASQLHAVAGRARGHALQGPPPPGSDRLEAGAGLLRLPGARGAAAWAPGRLRLFAFGSSDAVGLEAHDALRRHRAADGALPPAWTCATATPVGRGELEVGATWGLDRFGIDNVSPVKRRPGDIMGSLFAIDQTPRARAGLHAPAAARALTLRSGADVEHRRARGVPGHAAYPPAGGRRATSACTEEQPQALATFSGRWAELLWETDSRAGR